MTTLRVDYMLDIGHGLVWVIYGYGPGERPGGLLICFKHELRVRLEELA